MLSNRVALDFEWVIQPVKTKQAALTVVSRQSPAAYSHGSLLTQNMNYILHSILTLSTVFFCTCSTSVSAHCQTLIFTPLKLFCVHSIFLTLRDFRKTEHVKRCRWDEPLGKDLTGQDLLTPVTGLCLAPVWWEKQTSYSLREKSKMAIDGSNTVCSHGLRAAPSTCLLNLTNERAQSMSYN